MEKKEPQKNFLTGLALVTEKAFKEELGLYDVIGLIEVFKITLVNDQSTRAREEVDKERDSYKSN